MSLEATEAECAAGRTAPRVSLQDIENAIIAKYFFTAGEAIAAIPLAATAPTKPLDLLTISIVQMKNGFTVIGKSAPASPANFDVELGRKLAYEDAVRQIWPLMGFALRDRLAA
jgi:hypothetical protein